MPIVTAKDFILAALRRCGQMRPGYTPPPEILAEGMAEWTSLFDGWDTDREMGFSMPQFTYSVLGPGSQSGGNGYQIGPTAIDWVGPRPTAIVRANMKITAAGASPFYLRLTPLSAEDWADMSIRQMPGISITSAYYYDPQYPNGVLNVFPPLTAGNAIELFEEALLIPPVNLADSYSAPPGYRDAIIFSLAERLSPLCTKAMSARPVPIEWLAGTAYEACAKVRQLNRQIPGLATDFPRSQVNGGGFYDSNVTRTGLPI